MMHPNQCEVVILKPTSVFLSFLKTQLPESDLPTLNLLQVDTTAYIMNKQNTDEETLNEIERHFSTMFRHEICRWLGPDARHEIEKHFLDFLCCFKFEMHSHLLLMEPLLSRGKQVIRVRPRMVLLKWMKANAEDEEESPVFEETMLAPAQSTYALDNATVVIKNFKQLDEVMPFISANYRALYESEMERMCDNADLWPNVDSFEMFSRYFTIDIHTQLIHLN